MLPVLQALMVAAFFSSPETPPPAEVIHKTMTNINWSEADETGALFVATHEGGMIFTVRPANGSLDQPISALIDQANRQGRSIEVQFNIEAASLTENGMNFYVPLCAVRIDETEIKTISGCAEGDGERLSGNDLRIARAIAARSERRPANAISEAKAAIDSGQLNDTQLRMALRTRIGAMKLLADDTSPRSEAADRLMVSILRDTERLFRLRPLADVAIELSATLRALGDYERAKQVLDDAAKEWPDDDISIDYERSSLARQIDEPNESLAILNAMAAKHGPMEGMRFYYHRGWTLTNLGRFDEAIADFTTGIQGQPDYPYAYVRRACAYAQVGELRRALSDLNDGIGQVDSMLSQFIGGAVRFDRNHSAALAHILEQDIASGRTAPRPEICKGYYGDYDTPRKPSRLLSL